MLPIRNINAFLKIRCFLSYLFLNVKNKYAEKITRLGYSHAKTEEGKRAFYFSNLINLVIITMFLVVLLGDLINILMGKGDINYFIANILLELICIVNLTLNSKGKIHISRILLLVSIFILLFILTPLLNPVRSEAYFWYPYVPTGASLVVYFLFLKEKEQKYLIIPVLMNFMIVLFSDTILDYLTMKDLPIKSILKEDYLSYKLNPAIMFIFVNMTLFYAFQRSRGYEANLNEAKEKLTQKNKELVSSSADKDKINSVIAHDLQGPISSLLNMTYIMKEDPSTLAPENREKFVSMLYQSTNQISKLLENLLEWSQVQTGTMMFNPVKTDLRILIKDVVSMQETVLEEKKIVLTEDYNNVDVVTVDINMMRTIIRNLLSNALKFTPTNGHVDINAEKDEEHVTITISDSGQGMSKERKEKLFKSRRENIFAWYC